MARPRQAGPQQDDQQLPIDQQFPDLARMAQQQRLGYIDEQTLLRSLNQQRMLAGKEPARSIEEAVGAPPRPVHVDEVPPLQIDPNLFRGRGVSTVSTTQPQDNSYGSAIASIGNMVGRLLQPRQQQQQGAPGAAPRPGARGVPYLQPGQQQAIPTIGAQRPIRDISPQTNLKIGGSMKPQGLLIHHTGGNEPNAEAVADVLRNRGLSVQFVIDKEGHITQLVPDGRVAFHAGALEKGGGRWGNSNMEGVEVIGSGENDINPAQRAAVAQLVAERSQRWGWDPKTSVWGHGELTGRKEANEGTTARMIREGKLQVPGGQIMPAGGASGPLANERARFGAELQNPQVREQLTRLTAAENPQNPQAFMESVFNRASARGQTLQQTISDRNYYPNPGGKDPGSARPAIEGALKDVMGGSNVTKYATGNASGKVGFGYGKGAGDPYTHLTPNGERYGVENNSQDIAWSKRMQQAAAPTGTPSASPIEQSGKVPYGPPQPKLPYQTKPQAEQPATEPAPAGDMKPQQPVPFTTPPTPEQFQQGAQPAAPNAPNAQNAPAAQEPAQPARTMQLPPVTVQAPLGPQAPAQKISPAQPPVPKQTPQTPQTPQAAPATQWRAVPAKNADPWSNLGGNIDAAGNVTSGIANVKLRSALMEHPAFKTLPPAIQQHIANERINLNKLAPYRDRLGLTDAYMEKEQGIRFERVPPGRTELTPERIQELAQSPQAMEMARVRAREAGIPLPPERPQQAPLEPGNIDLKNRPIVPDQGGYATVKSMQTGEHLGKFANPEAASRYGQQLHLDQEKLYGPRIRELQQRGPVPLPPERPPGAPQLPEGFARELVHATQPPELTPRERVYQGHQALLDQYFGGQANPSEPRAPEPRLPPPQPATTGEQLASAVQPAPQATPAAASFNERIAPAYGVQAQGQLPPLSFIQSAQAGAPMPELQMAPPPVEPTWQAPPTMSTGMLPPNMYNWMEPWNAANMPMWAWSMPNFEGGSMGLADLGEGFAGFGLGGLGE